MTFSNYSVNPNNPFTDADGDVYTYNPFEGEVYEQLESSATAVSTKEDRIPGFTILPSIFVILSFSFILFRRKRKNI